MDPQFFLQIGSVLGWIGLCLLPLFLLPLLTLVVPGLVEPVSRWLYKGIDRITDGAAAISIFTAICLLGFQLVAVIAAYAFGLSWTWLSELVVYAFAATFMIGACVALRDNAHVRVDILRPRFGETGRNWIELVGIYLLLFPICVRILQTGEQGLARTWLLFEGSRESDGLPLLFLFKTLVPIFAVLMISQGLSEALKAALRLTGKLAPADEAEAEVHYGA